MERQCTTDDSPFCSNFFINSNVSTNNEEIEEIGSCSLPHSRGGKGDVWAPSCAVVQNLQNCVHWESRTAQTDGLKDLYSWFNISSIPCTDRRFTRERRLIFADHTPDMLFRVSWSETSHGTITGVLQLNDCLSIAERRPWRSSVRLRRNRRSRVIARECKRVWTKARKHIETSFCFKLKSHIQQITMVRTWRRYAHLTSHLLCAPHSQSFAGTYLCNLMVRWLQTSENICNCKCQCTILSAYPPSSWISLFLIWSYCAT
jgi:hypothetical protein